MPLYKYSCSSCGAEKARILVVAKAKAHVQICTCGAAMARDAAAPSTQVVERLDNGAMTKVLERPVDAQRLHYDRAHKDPLKDE